MSLALHYWMGDVHHVSKMTYTVSSGTLNSTIPYHTLRMSTSCYSILWFLNWRKYRSGRQHCWQATRMCAQIMAPWKNRISSTTMKLRKSLVKPVMRQNISSCLVLPPEIIMHDALMLFSERCVEWDIKLYYTIPYHSLNVRRYMHRRAWRSRVEEPNNT